MITQIALIGDIHGNLPALEAVLADIEAHGVKRIFCLGDMLGKGPQPIEAMDILREKCEKIIVGNWEALVVANNPISASTPYLRKKIGPERLRWIESLPKGIFLRMGGKNVKLLHGRNTVREVLYPDQPHEKLLELMDSMDDASDVVGFADIHQPFYRMVSGRILFNTGAVGNPCDGLAMASYAILRGGDGEDPAPVSVEIVRVPYEIERAVQLANDCEDMIYRQEYIEEVRTARYRERVFFKYEEQQK